MSSEGNQGKDPKKNKSAASGWQSIDSVSHLGFSMAVSIIGCFWLGSKLDSHFGTSPWLLIIMTLLGVAASFKVMFDSVKK